jgi:glucosamine-6-phosphate deaminase
MAAGLTDHAWTSDELVAEATDMKIVVASDKQELGGLAAADGAERIRMSISARGIANVVLATGASQFEVLAALTRAERVSWNRVSFFHLDEYVGLGIEHPASFRRYLWERFFSRLPLPPRAIHFLDTENDAAAECERVGRLIASNPIDLAFVGIGENGHLAFNDPPADFDVETPFMVVNLDEACRRQQWGEGWFASLAAVPGQAISMSIRQILKASAIVCCVPDARKANAVRAAVEGPVTPSVPASILQRHPAATIYLDPESSRELARPR